MSCTKAKRTGRKKHEERRGWKRAANMPIAEQSSRSGILSLLLLSGVAGSASFDIDQSSPQLGAYE